MINGRITARWILNKHVVRVRTAFIGSGQGPVAESCEHSNEYFDSIKGREFLG
jgi:hypothetical protein